VLETLAEDEIDTAVETQPSLDQDRPLAQPYTAGVETFGGSINLRQLCGTARLTMLLLP
jgi:hypothetical protein